MQKFKIEYEQKLERLKDKTSLLPLWKFGTKINKVAVFLDKMQVRNDCVKSWQISCFFPNYFLTIYNNACWSQKKGMTDIKKMKDIRKKIFEGLYLFAVNILIKKKIDLIPFK